MSASSPSAPFRQRAERALGPLVLVASLLGLVFALYSTYDYALHLDRQVHAVHCSFIPGAPAVTEGENACKAALFSPYSALFRATFWGGLPISLFAVGAFTFFAGFGAYLTLARGRADRHALTFLAVAGLGPFVASLAMGTIAATQLGSFCKLCVGIYVSSTALAVAAGLALFLRRPAPRAAGTSARSDGAERLDAVTPEPAGAFRLAAMLTFAFGLTSLLPAAAYALSVPDHAARLTACGTLVQKTETHGALLKLRSAEPRRAALLFEDPLCPTCKAFHERLRIEGALERLDMTLALFPLDTECNWMLDRPLHPGACALSRAILCAADPRAALEWAFQNQDDLREAGRAGVATIKRKIEARFGPELVACVDDRRTSTRLNQHLHFASKNRIPVSTPQLFLGEQRVCEEDTDLGLRFTLKRLAPELLP